MVATLVWQKSEATAATFGNIVETSLRFKGANNNLNDNNNPLIRPTTGINYSYEKALRIQIFFSIGSVSLSTLRVKLSTADIAAALTSGSISQAYAWKAVYTQPQQYSGGTGGVGGAMPTRVGVLGTAEIGWSGAAASSDLTTLPKFWPSSDVLYCQLEVKPGSGGILTAWNTIAIYNEV